MDRLFAYAGAIPQDTDVLSTNKNMLYGLGHLIQAALGTGTSVVGLVGAQTAVPSLQITIGPGAIYAQETVDATAYGDLGTDANTLMKQGINKAAQTLTLTAPTTSGYSQVYLVEAAYQDIDGGATVLPYYNSSNPAAPYAGPNNAGTSNYTVRQGACVITLKAGTAAPTGSQTTPSTDSGYVPLYTITLANGQTAITTAQIVTATGAPFVPYNLNNLPFLKSQTDTGTANALVVTEPAISALFVGLTLTIKKSSSANTGAATLNVNGLGATTLVWADGTVLVAGDWPASVTGIVEYDGTQWNLLSVMGPSVFARASAAIVGNIAKFTTSQTWTVPAGVTTIKNIQCWGAGGGGGGAGSVSATAGAGGGSGGYAESVNIAVTPGAGITVTVGTGGAGGGGAGTDGAAGGTTSFGASCSASGGGGGTGAVSGSGAPGGSGGSTFTGAFSINGNTGGSPINLTSNPWVSGAGAGAPFVGSSASGNQGTAGSGGTFPGGGGNGGAATGSSGTAGGAGGAGLVIITY